MQATDVVDVDVLEVDTVSQIQSREGRRSHISKCVERGSRGMTRFLFMCDAKIVGASTWVAKNIPIGWPGDSGKVQELVEGMEIVVFRAGGTWVFCSDEGICGHSDPSLEPLVTLTKAGIRDSDIDALSRNRCYTFIVQTPGMISANGIVFSVPRCCCTAVWNWMGKNHLHALPPRDWDAVSCTLPRIFPVDEGRSLCKRLTPDACVGIIALVDGKLTRYMNIDLIRLARIRDGSTREFALCLQQAGVHSLAGCQLPETCVKLSVSGIGTRYIKMYRRAVEDLWKSYMQVKVWKTESYPRAKVVRYFVDALHKDYIKRIGLENSRTDIHRVQLYIASKCPASLADVIMRWREQRPMVGTP